MTTSPQQRLTDSITRNEGLAAPQHKLDNTDLTLLAMLRKNARLTNIELSSLIGLTPQPCLVRWRNLEAKGFIQGYRAEVDVRKLGFNAVAFVYVGLKSQADSDLRAFQSELQMWGIVQEAYALQGEIDYLLRCVARDLTELKVFLKDVLLLSPNVKTVKTSLLMDVVKQTPELPTSRFSAS
jgi:DNA-binding Lrp family transcriptional regulator